MTHEQFARERDYGAAAALAAEMVARGLVTPEECAKMDAQFRQMYKPCIARISALCGVDFQAGQR